MDIKGALRLVGDANGYQVYTIAFVCFKWMIVAFMIFGPSYMLMVPTFNCGQQTRVSEEDACKRIHECTIDNPFTVTAVNKLYCDDRYIRDGLLSSEYIGSVAGLIVLSVLADKLGRKLIINVTLLLSLIGSVLFGLGALENIYYLTGAGIVLMGLGGYSLSIVSFIYLGEVCNDRWRQVSIILSYTFWAIAEMLFYPLLKISQDWKFLLAASTLGPLVVLGIMSWWIVETPEFLYANVSKVEALDSLNYIARFNNKAELQFEDVQSRRLDTTERFALSDTIFKLRFFIPLVVLSVAQVCNNGMYYITQYSINQIGATFEMDMLIIGALEFVAYLITSKQLANIDIYCHKMKRKRWLIFFMLVSGGIGILFQFVFRREDKQWDADRYIETVFIGISRLANTFGFGLYSLITTESFPSSIKTTGTGIVEAMSNLGNMASPFIVTLADKFSLQSMFIGGVICAFGGLIMFFSKETLEDKPAKPTEDASRTTSLAQQPLLRQSTLDANTSQPEVQARP